MFFFCACGGENAILRRRGHHRFTFSGFQTLFRKLKFSSFFGCRNQFVPPSCDVGSRRRSHHINPFILIEFPQIGYFGLIEHSDPNLQKMQNFRGKVIDKRKSGNFPRRGRPGGKMEESASHHVNDNEMCFLVRLRRRECNVKAPGASPDHFFRFPDTF